MSRISTERAHLALRAGRRVRLDATLELSPAGLLAIGGLVAAILLSTAVLVNTAARAARH